ncbi:PAS domain-containing protein [Haloplanus pelagicus]|uniref:PAS domain-containing protein n=1 Tax=Haloplanus pelagicus TaxID=2949995 RepID=UPI00203FFB9C|nr:PAS domain-containing protein [Haloplanus sp. HW8-1]
MSSRGHVLCVGSEGWQPSRDALADAVGDAEIRTATTAAEALELVSAWPADCVVAASRLPAGDGGGLALLERVRAVEPDLPFVLHPAEGSERLASEAIGAGVTDYVAGTDGTERLGEAVMAAIDGSDGESARIADLVRTIQQRLVRARTTEEIDRGVCEAIVDTEPYAFAWIGEYDAADGRVVPRASAGFESGYLEAIEIRPDDSSLGQGPTGRAVRTRTLEAVQDIPSEPTYEPWRADAMERTYRSSAAVPLVREETLYGVLNVYADRTDAFDESENALLCDLGKTVAHAFHRVRIQDRYEAQYRELFEEAPVMVALTEDTADGPVIDDCNRRFAAKLGWSREALRGRPLADVYSEASVARLLDHDGYERALAGEFATAERTLLTRGNERLETLLQATPRRNTHGDVVGTHALYVDMTEQKRAREVIDQAEAMEASMDGMAILEPSGEYVYANQAHADIYGYDDPAVFLGNTWRMNYDDAEVDRFESEVFPAVAGGDEWRGEATGVRADGSPFPQELSLSPLADGRYICVVRDATERRRYERRLERQRDNLEILNQVVRHDIRNDLQVVLGYVESLRTFVGEDRTAHVERAVESARDAVEITETAGDVAEVMLTADAETKPVGLGCVLDEQVSEVRSTYEDTVLTTDGTIPDVDVRADNMLGSVFRNLLTNAVEHNDGAIRKVTVAAAADADTATVRVADNGPGIPDDRKDAIFEEGEKGLDSGGTGLGLYLAETLVDRYGGDIRVGDNDPNGAVFTVELPVVD